MTSVIIVKSVILFKRDAVRDKQVSHSSRMFHLQPDWQPDLMGNTVLDFWVAGVQHVFGTHAEEEPHQESHRVSRR